MILADPSSLSPHADNYSLLYHALHIVLRRPYLTSHNLALKAQSTKVCITHSKQMHAIHSLYAHTFPHRLMTYQISYCIFSAATVEIQMMKTAANQADKDDAAARLAYAVRVLQNEASHTPGSGRSLDTIRRLLNAGLEQPIQSAGHRYVANVSSVGQAHPGARHDDGESGLSSIPPVSRDILDPSAQTHSLIAGEEFSTSMFSSEGAWGDHMGLAGLDTGAGFHPDAFSWGMANNFPRGTEFYSRGGPFPPYTASFSYPERR